MYKILRLVTGKKCTYWATKRWKCEGVCAPSGPPAPLKMMPLFLRLPLKKRSLLLFCVCQMHMVMHMYSSLSPIFLWFIGVAIKSMKPMPKYSGDPLIMSSTSMYQQPICLSDALRWLYSILPDDRSHKWGLWFEQCKS